MIQTGKTIILTEGEYLFQGQCTVDLVNKAHNILSISIDKQTGIEKIKVLKSRFKIENS